MKKKKGNLFSINDKEKLEEFLKDKEEERKMEKKLREENMLTKIENSKKIIFEELDKMKERQEN